jgi:putative PIN family toxin of toxin-antitoxin system
LAVRRRRVPVVLDTNILVATFLSRNPRSASLRVYRMWAARRLQLVTSNEIEEEYLGVLADLGASQKHLEGLAHRLATRQTVTRVRPSRPIPLSRDPDDNKFLAAAVAAEARFLVTNDGDLLQIPMRALRPFGLRILTPAAFLEAIEQLRR